MPDFDNLNLLEIAGWVLNPTMMIAWEGGKELIIDDSVFAKDDVGRFVHLLPPTSRIRIRARYTLFAAWKGPTPKPGNEVLREQLLALGVDVYNTPTATDSLLWEIEPNVDTLTAGDVVRVMANEGASAVGLFRGGAWRSPEALKDLGERAQDVKAEIDKQIGDLGDAIVWWARWWWVPSLVIGLVAIAVAVWWFFGAPLPKRRRKVVQK